MSTTRHGRHSVLPIFQGLPLFDEKFQGMDARFLNLDEKIEVVQSQLFELQYGKED